ncbi:hypothetical protein [Cupriavidus taiwanensis]|uniref:hypothetical protein n=1 Tax=Cupriavidus taiwanensis TaxID=164546 RepID=UPI003B63248C
MKSTTASALHTAAQAAAPMSGALIGLFAVCAGALVANLYYAQPIIELIAPAALNMVPGQRAIYALDAPSRGRLNALDMTAIFAGARLDPHWRARCTRISVGPAWLRQAAVLPRYRWWH